jgi:hypothetical protein
MLPFLLSPLVKAGAIAVGVLAVVLAVAIYLHSVRVAGADAERAAEAQSEAAHTSAVLKNSSRIDQSTWADPNPQATLKKEWERPQ